MTGWYFHTSDDGDFLDAIGHNRDNRLPVKAVDINIKDLRTVHFTTANGVTDKKSF